MAQKRNPVSLRLQTRLKGKEKRFALSWYTDHFFAALFAQDVRRRLYVNHLLNLHGNWGDTSFRLPETCVSTHFFYRRSCILSVLLDGRSEEYQTHAFLESRGKSRSINISISAPSSKMWELSSVNLEKDTQVNLEKDTQNTVLPKQSARFVDPTICTNPGGVNEKKNENKKTERTLFLDPDADAQSARRYIERKWAEIYILKNSKEKIYRCVENLYSNLLVRYDFLKQVDQSVESEPWIENEKQSVPNALGFRRRGVVSPLQHTISRKGNVIQSLPLKKVQSLVAMKEYEYQISFLIKPCAREVPNDTKHVYLTHPLESENKKLFYKSRATSLLRPFYENSISSCIDKKENSKKLCAKTSGLIPTSLEVIQTLLSLGEQRTRYKSSPSTNTQNRFAITKVGNPLVPLSNEFTTMHLVKALSVTQNVEFCLYSIAFLCKKRYTFARIKQYILSRLQANQMVSGARLLCTGRMGGRSKSGMRAQNQSAYFGKTPISIFSSRLAFASTDVDTSFGKVGIKLWICYK